MKKIFIAGNIAAGKSFLARKLAKKYKLPLTHVDSIQFLPGLIVRPIEQARLKISQIEATESWIIDGYGPLDQIENRFVKADLIIFVDWPLWKHFYWLLKRQVQILFTPRKELPIDCDEFTWSHIKKLVQTLLKVHFQMRPELLKIFQKDRLKHKVLIINDMKSYRRLYS